MRLNLRFLAKGFLIGLVQTMAISVSAAAAPAGSLAGTVSPAPAAVYLTEVGTADWTHWGLTTASTLNRKSGVPQQISGLTLLGAAPGRFASDPSWTRHHWTGGTPTPSQAGFSGGIYFARIGNGYRLTVPAGTAQRTLMLDMGGWASTGEIRATLSDGSAPPYVMSFGDASKVYARVATLIFSALSNGQTLTVQHTMRSGNGNIGLQAAALTGPAVGVNAAPTIVPVGNQLVTARGLLAFTVTASDPDGPGPLAMTVASSVPALPVGASYVDRGNGTGTFNWTPLNTDVGTYQVTFRATDGGGKVAQQVVAIAVIAAPAPGNGALTGAVVAGPSIVNLTTSGAGDWVDWGLLDASSVNRKAAVAAQIGQLTPIGGPARRFADNTLWSGFSWTDGVPTLAKTKFSGGIYFTGNATGYQLTVPAATTQQRTLRLYLGGWASTSRLEATLSDGSAAPFVVNFSGVDVYSCVATLTFRAATTGQTLTVRHTQVGKAGNIGLQAATLSPITQSPADPNPPPPAVGRIFPANNIWNTRVDRAPLHPRSADWMANWFHAGHDLHMDFGTMYDSRYNGIPYNIVGNATPRRQVLWNPARDHRNESDPLPSSLPIPDNVKIEGDPRPWDEGDHHLILHDVDRNELHEMYNMAVDTNGNLLTNFYGRWDLTSNALRTNGWTSADVAGLPILPGLVKYDEAASGVINHALRFTVVLSWGKVWPARHPGTSGDARFPPMGTRVRLKSDVDITLYPGTNSPVSPINQAILRAAKDYGMILADHGGDWFISGSPDSRWDDSDLHNLIYFSPMLFEVVDQDALMIDPDSGEARQL